MKYLTELFSLLKRYIRVTRRERQFKKAHKHLFREMRKRLCERVSMGKETVNV